MHCIFRVDASIIIGTGHVIRCLTLAEELSNRGISVHFVSRLHHRNLCDFVKSRGFYMHRLAESSSECSTGDTLYHAKWLGVAWQRDADETLAVITSLNDKPTWLIVDHYGIDRRWETYLRASVEKILCIDDLADRSHDCDILLDQNLVENKKTRYSGFVSKTCNQLLGEKFALLQPDYAELHKQVLIREGKIQRILIFFGGADTDNFTGMALQAFLNIDRKDIEVDVVIGSLCPHRQKIRELVRGVNNIFIYYDLPTLAPLMLKADLAIGAAGTTSWERCCLGLPTLGISLAENQKPIAKFLHKKGLLYWLGHKDNVDCALLTGKLKKVVSHGLEKKWSQKCYDAVDGSGKRRVVDSMLTVSKKTFYARRVDASDEELLLNWANEKDTRRNSFSNTSITPHEHHLWLQKQLADSAHHFLLIVEDLSNHPIGQVRFDRAESNEYTISYSLSKECRGKKISYQMLDAALREFLQTNKEAIVTACVKKENVASQRILERLNFFLVESEKELEFLTYKYGQSLCLK